MAKLRDVTAAANLSHVSAQEEKVLQIRDALTHRQAVIVTGEAGTGKTTTWRVPLKSKSQSVDSD